MSIFFNQLPVYKTATAGFVMVTLDNIGSTLLSFRNRPGENLLVIVRFYFYFGYFLFSIYLFYLFRKFIAKLGVMSIPDLVTMSGQTYNYKR